MKFSELEDRIARLICEAFKDTEGVRLEPKDFMDLADAVIAEVHASRFDLD